MQRNPLIAVVDDDPSMRDAIAELLEVLDFDSAVFATADEFLAVVEEGGFACLVSDVRMPGTDGFNLVRQLARIAPELPVIFVSSIDDASTIRRAEQAGAIAFMLKPLDPDELEGWLSKALGPE